ncbi:MAG: hypothetical protein CM1200mP25_4480 [Acidobacteriota bacterium]|nr:MAG: hypothetical protein CM1200mP25_4480 [Acidobacteriota bacterium]
MCRQVQALLPILIQLRNMRKHEPKRLHLLRHSNLPKEVLSRRNRLELKTKMIIVIDNYDSFTYNLVQYLGELGAELRVFRNDAVTVSEIADLKPAGIVISPGPGRPEQAGISVDLIRNQSECTPILGVCLGHQAIGQAYGAQIVSAPALLHGKSSPVVHDGRDLLAGVKSPFEAGRYHSL